MKHLSKTALAGALVVAALVATAAQAFDGAHDQSTPAFTQQQFRDAPQHDENKSNVGENGGA